MSTVKLFPCFLSPPSGCDLGVSKADRSREGETVVCQVNDDALRLAWTEDRLGLT